MDMEARAIARFIRMSPRKVRLLADLVRGKTFVQAETQLLLAAKAAKEPLLKLLQSARANAEVKKMDISKLYIKKVTIDGGPVLKRMRPRAFGRGAPIRKPTSHITVVLGEK